MLTNFQKFHENLFNWFKQHKRDLPWRIDRTPYRVWISETMLQQTRVFVVVKYFLRWMQRFPDILSVSNATEQEILLYWQGLGYYSRAKNLHRTAKILTDHHGETFPQSIQQMQTLPGIGLYTASAIAVFSFQQKHPLVEANIRRVLSRIFGIQKSISLSALQKDMWKVCQSLLPQQTDLVAIFNEALMELGALICTATIPKCWDCPVEFFCIAKKKSLQTVIPTHMPKKTMKLVYRDVFVIENPPDKFWLQKRKESLSLLGGLWEFPYRERDGTDLFSWKEVGSFVHHYTNNKVLVRVLKSSYSSYTKEFLLDSSGMWVDKKNLDKKPMHAGSIKVLQLLGIHLV